PRVMRLAGFIHRKGTPFLSRIVQINDIAPHKWKELREAFPPPATEKNQVVLTAAPEFADLPHASLAEGLPSTPPELREQWKKLNSEAIRRYSNWVLDIFPTASSTGNGGYRVSSADLGRDLDEDLSFHPEGIKDFGVHDIGDPREGRRT